MDFKIFKNLTFYLNVLSKKKYGPGCLKTTAVTPKVKSRSLRKFSTYHCLFKRFYPKSV